MNKNDLIREILIRKKGKVRENDIFECYGRKGSPIIEKKKSPNIWFVVREELEGKSRHW